MTKIKDLHRRWSRDDHYKAAYDGLEGEFRLARALIEARSQKHRENRFLSSEDPTRRRKQTFERPPLIALGTVFE